MLDLTAKRKATWSKLGDGDYYSIDFSSSSTVVYRDMRPTGGNYYGFRILNKRGEPILRIETDGPAGEEIKGMIVQLFEKARDGYMLTDETISDLWSNLDGLSK